MTELPFRRVLVKLSGQALMGDKPSGIDIDRVMEVARQVRLIRDSGVEIAMVIGGGNFLRGAEQAELGLDRATGDYMGMLATILNALPLQDALERLGVPTRVLSALEVSEVAEPYNRRRAMGHLAKGRVVIFAGGTGNPFVTTDTAGALRALEIGADALFMAKNGVEGVYDADPRTSPEASFIPQLTHADALVRDLKVMDATALALCSDHGLAIHVFDMDGEDAIARVVGGERLGTLVTSA